MTLLLPVVVQLLQSQSYSWEYTKTLVSDFVGLWASLWVFVPITWERSEVLCLQSDGDVCTSDSLFVSDD